AVGGITSFLTAGPAPGAQGDRSPPLLSGHSPAQPDPSPRLDAAGDPLPAGALVRLGTVRFRHQQPVSKVAFSPDGRVFATIDVGVDERVDYIHAGGSLRFWDRASGRELHLLRPRPSGYVLSAVFSADGRSVFVGTREGTLRRWDLTSGKELPPWKELTGGISRLVLSADGRTLAALSDWKIRVWDLPTGREKPTLNIPDGYVPYALALSPDGRVVASGGAGSSSRKNSTLRLWDTTTGKQILHPEGDVGHISALVFSPDGKLLLSAGSFCPRITLWDAATGKKLRQLCGKSETVLTAAFSPDGRA